MKILFSSHFFPPSVGGLEEVGEILAREFARAGHEVVVVTQSRGAGDFPFPVKRRPGLGVLARLTRWSDVVFHNNISLRTALPLAVIRRPWVVAHHTWLARMDGRLAPVDRLKRGVTRHARNIAVSRAIATSLGTPARVIGNPYRDDVFTDTGLARDGDVMFLGRLVSDKGADILLRALRILKDRGVELRAAIVGDGPERAALEALGEGMQVTFCGRLGREEIAPLLNRHRALAVPSRWEEPYGIVALEAMACGCVPVVARSGGLPEAVGDAGVLFEKENPGALAAALEGLLRDEARLARLRVAAAPRLARHRAEGVARQYMEVIEEAVAE